MSLKTRFNPKNVLDESSAQTEIWFWTALCRKRPMGRSDGEFQRGYGVNRRTAPSVVKCIADALERIRSEAEDAVRSGAGHLS